VSCGGQRDFRLWEGVPGHPRLLLWLHRAAILFWDAVDATNFRAFCHRRERCAFPPRRAARAPAHSAPTLPRGTLTRTLSHREQWVYLAVPLFIAAPVFWALRALTLPPALSALAVALSTASLAAFCAAAAMDPGVLPRAGAAGALPPPPPGAHLVGGPLAPLASSPAPGGGPGTPRGLSLSLAGSAPFWESARDPSAHRWCTACEIYRPPRAAHCSVCGSCCSRQDHHCLFVANCVGERNFRFFIAFLLCTVALQLLGLGVTGCALWLRAQALRSGVDPGRDAEAAAMQAARDGGGSQALFELARACWRAASESPGATTLLAYCFSTLTGTAPLAAHYILLTLLDSTAREQTALRRSGGGAAGGSSWGALLSPFRGLRPSELARNVANQLCGPLPPSRVWGRGGSGGGGGGAPADAAAEGAEAAERGAGLGAEAGATSPGGKRWPQDGDAGGR